MATTSRTPEEIRASIEANRHDLPHSLGRLRGDHGPLGDVPWGTFVDDVPDAAHFERFCTGCGTSQPGHLEERAAPPAAPPRTTNEHAHCFRDRPRLANERAHCARWASSEHAA